MTNKNPNKFYSARKYTPKESQEKMGIQLLGRTSKACQINCHGACKGFARQYRKCKCECHTKEADG